MTASFLVVFCMVSQCACCETFVWNGSGSDSPTIAEKWLVGGSPATFLPGADDTIRIDSDRTLTFVDDAGLQLLAGVSEVRADGTVVCTGPAVGYVIPASVAFSGRGTVRFVSAAHVILWSDASAFSGEMFFSNNVVYVNNRSALGTGPVTFFTGRNTTKKMQIQASGVYSNDFNIVTEGENSQGYYLSSMTVVTNVGLMTCRSSNCFRLDVNQAGSSLTVQGGIVDQSSGGGYVRLEGDITLESGCFRSENGFRCAAGTVKLAAPLDGPLVVANGTARFMREGVLNGQNLKLVYDSANPGNGVLDLNGYSQEGAKIIQKTSGNHVRMLLTSTGGPATLSFEDVETWNASSFFRIGGKLSMNCRVPWHQIETDFYLNNEKGDVSDTKGDYIARGGSSCNWTVFGASARFPNLHSLQMIGGRIKVVDGAQINPRAYLVFEKDDADKSGTLYLYQDMTVRYAKVNGQFLPAGTYSYASGGGAFLSKDSTGMLTVSQDSDKSGFVIRLK